GKILPMLSGTKAFGQGYRIETSTPPHVACDYTPGRTLAQMIEKAKVEQIPLGVDHALSILQGIAQGIVHLHSKGLSHGLLTPHSVWVSFEGATEILDAPYAQAIRQVLPKSPVTKGSLETYLREVGGNALQQDFFSMGAMLYELLTFEKLPLMAEPAFAAGKASLKAAQEDTPVPPEILSLMKRLMGVGDPFSDVQTFNTEMDHVLYDGDYSPTTFNMAFFMHTLFREENDRDGAAVKAEQAENFAAYSSEADSIHASRPHSEVSEAEEAQTTRVSKKGLYGGIAAAVVVVGVLGFFALKPKGESEEVIKMRTELAQLQAAQAEKEAQLAGASQANQARLEALKKQQSEATSAKDQALLEQQIKEEERKRQELEQKKADLKKQQDEAKARAAQIAQATQQAAPRPTPAPQVAVAPKVEPPKPEPPKPAPASTPAAPTPTPAPEPPRQAPTPAVPQQTQAAPTVVQETSATVANRAQPTFPMRARQMRFEVDKSHSVKVKVFVDAQGRPQKVTVISGVDGSWGFNEAAHDAASRSTYTPATRDGKPVAGYTIVEYVFGASGRH
ncbi:MAG: energy transducer TonB, partial [Acidobacteriota bacterium]|nr:energy transducer TonB [Acidobacteriota bacterium]